MGWKEELLLVGTILYIGINITFFVPIVHVTHRLIKAYQAAGKKPNRVLFLVGLLFNLVTAASVFGLLFMTCLKLEAIETQSELHDNVIWRRYHGIFVLFYGKQNALMLLVLYLRIYFIFNGTRMKFKRVTFWFFNGAFAGAILIFTSLPVVHSQHTQLSIWTICASSFCVYNVTFMSLLSYLFASKLLSSFRGIQGSGNRKGRQSVVNMCSLWNCWMIMINMQTTKTSLLAMFSITLTMTSCVLLILRYSIHYESKVVYVMSNWLMSLDIYSNFIFVSLTMAYFDKYYRLVFGRVDLLFKRFLYWVVTRGDVDSMRLAEYFEQHEKEVNGGEATRKRTVTNTRSVAHIATTPQTCTPSEAAKEAEGSQGTESNSTNALPDDVPVVSTKVSESCPSARETQHGGDVSTDSIPSKQPEHDPNGVPVPSCSVITERVDTSRSGAVAISVDSVDDTLESGLMGGAGSEAGSETGDSVVAAPPKRASVIRTGPVYAHQSSTTMSSIRDSKDETPSTCTHSRSEDLV